LGQGKAFAQVPLFIQIGATPTTLPVVTVAILESAATEGLDTATPALPAMEQSAALILSSSAKRYLTFLAGSLGRAAQDYWHKKAEPGWLC